MTDEYKPPRYATPRFKMPTSGHPVTREFFAIAAEECTSLKEVAAKAGISWTNILNWKNKRLTAKCRGAVWRRTSPGIELIDAALNTLGYKLAIVPESFPGVRLSYKSLDLPE